MGLIFGTYRTIRGTVRVINKAGRQLDRLDRAVTRASANRIGPATDNRTSEEVREDLADALERLRLTIAEGDEFRARMRATFTETPEPLPPVAATPTPHPDAAYWAAWHARHAELAADRQARMVETHGFAGDLIETPAPAVA